MNPAFTDDDLATAIENCASEPVHIPGCIQAFGAMIVCDAQSLEITDVSANLPEFTGLTVQQVLSGNIEEVLGSELLARLRRLMQKDTLAETREHLGSRVIDQRLLSFSTFSSDQSMIIELEPVADSSSESPDRDSTGPIRTLVNSLKALDTKQRLFEVAVDALRKLTGFERVVIVRFDQKMNGEVLAESRVPDIESMHGLRFPEYDIPSQARALMAAIPLRIIADVNSASVPIVPNTRDFDITASELRGVSPVHIAYLRNMDVRSTMTLSIVLDGELWGYISFHSRTPVSVTRECRDTCLAALDIFCARLEILRYRRRLYKAEQFKSIAADLYQNIGADVSIADAVRANTPALLEHFDAQGLGLMVGGVWLSIGDAIGGEACKVLLQQLETRASGQVLSFDCLSELSCLQPFDLGRVAGAMVIQMFHEEAIFVFRNAVSTQVKWAGSPEKTISRADGTARLHPRASFAEFIEEYQNKCLAWSEDDIANARHMVEVNIRVGLERQMLLSMQRMNAELKRSNDELDNFAYVASHDLKEPLRGVAINANFLLQENISEQADRRIHRMIDLCNRMEKLIADLLYFSRLGRGNDCKANIDAHSVIEEIRRSLVETMEKRQCIIRVDTPLPTLYAERSKVKTVFHNLIVNAYKYNDAEQKTVEIGFIRNFRLPSGRLDSVFYVKDNGIGINHPDSDKVFRIFTRLNSEKIYGSGTGAGLAFVKKVVEHHEGQIFYVSRESEGTTFYFTLPTALATGKPGNSLIKAA